MAGSLGSLVVEVAANVARFQSDMGRVSQIAESAMQRVAQTSAIAASALKTVGGALAGVLAVGALREFAARTIESTAALKDLAEITGSSVEHMSALRSVAQVGGRDFEAITAAMVKMTKGLSGADEETKGAAQAIQGLGINLDRFLKLDAAERMLKLAQVLGTFRESTTKTENALAIMGKTGAAQLPFLKDLADQVELTGKITAEQAEAADQYEKNLRAMSKAADDFKKSVVLSMLPALRDITTAMREAQKEGGTFTALFVGLGGLFANSTIGQRVFGIGGAAIKEAQKQAAEIKRLTDGIDANERLVNEGGPGAARAAERLEQIRAKLQQLSAQALKTTDALKASVEPFKATEKPEAPSPPKPPRPLTEGERFIQQLQRQVQLQERGRDEMLRLEAAQKGVSVAARPYINRLEEIEIRQRNIARLVEDSVRAEEQRAKVGEIVSGGNDLAKQLIQQTQLLGLNAKEQRRVTELRKLDELTLKALTGATADTALEILKLADTMRGNLIRALEDAEKAEAALTGSFAFGAKRAFDAYVENAKNAAGFAENIVTGGLQRMEDAIVNFAKTGKLSFRDVFAFMAEEFLRQQIRMTVASKGGGIFSAIASFFGSSSATQAVAAAAPLALAGGMPYVPYDGMPALLHEGERVMTKAENAGGGWGPSISVGAGQVIQVGQGVSRSEVVSAIRSENARSEARIRRLMRQGNFA